MSAFLARVIASASAIMACCQCLAVEATVFQASKAQSRTLRIHAAADLEAMEPLIRDFQEARPDVAIEYLEGQTVDLFDRAQADCARRDSPFDLLISSSPDQLAKLANDGCALTAPRPPSDALPRWTGWRREVFGFTFEPGVIVYNKARVPEPDIRRTRADLIDLLRAKPDAYDGRVGVYDIERSGVGYLFALYDSRETTIYGRMLETLARSHAVTSCCTADLLSELSSGKLAIGYNLLGSYAVAAARKGASLTIVVPRDFTVVLSRAVMVPRHARNPGAAFDFIEYLLSPRGQAQSAKSSFFFSFDGPLPAEVDGPPTLASSSLLRPIDNGAASLVVQDRAKRKYFTSEWRRSFMSGPSGPR